MEHPAALENALIEAGALNWVDVTPSRYWPTLNDAESAVVPGEDVAGALQICEIFKDVVVGEDVGAIGAVDGRSEGGVLDLNEGALDGPNDGTSDGSSDGIELGTVDGPEVG